MAHGKNRTSISGNPALWTALAGAVLFLRFPALVLRPALWAEDGPIFFLQARVVGVGAFVIPYAGYLHLIPRAIASAGAMLDPGLVPMFYVYCSFALTLAVVARVFSPRLDLPMKPILALAIVAVPHNGEVFLCPTNIQWITALALLMTLFMGDPAGAWEWTADIAVLVGAGLTGPFSVFLAPFFLARALRRSTRASWVIFSAVALAALVQGTAILNSPRASPGGIQAPFDAANLAAILSARIPLELVGAHGWAFRVGRSAVLLAGAAAWAAVAWSAFSGGKFRAQRIALFLFCILLCVLSATRTRDDAWDFRESMNGERYFYLPRVIILWIAALCLCRASTGWRIAAVAATAGVFCAGYKVPYLAGPSYRDAAVQRPEVPWDRYCQQLRAGEEVTVRVSPGWRFFVPEREAPK